MKISTQTMVIAGAAAVVAFLVWKGGKAAVQATAGIVTGDNAATRNATNASGQPVTAYQGAGVAGTLGAVTNAASGGYLSSFGQWLGGKAYDLFGDSYDPNATPLIGTTPATGSSQPDTTTFYTGNGATGSGSMMDTDAFYDPNTGLMIPLQ